MFNIYNEALQAANDAAESKDIETGNNWWPCGNASVIVPGNTKFGKWCKENNLGYQGYYPSGLRISARTTSQKMSVNLAWAEEFCKVLALHNIKSTISSYID